jgi:hypothetical protein
LGCIAFIYIDQSALKERFEEFYKSSLRSIVNSLRIPSRWRVALECKGIRELTARLICQAGTKFGLSDMTVSSGRAVSLSLNK